MLPDYFIIFDCEFTAWENSLKYNWTRNNEEPEIISCSALKIENKNNNFKILDSFDYYIKPIINPKLSNYIIKLTGITQEIINNEGVDFAFFIEQFYNFSNNLNNKVYKLKLYSYGHDYNEIKRNLYLNNINKDSKYFEWEKNFFDIRIILNKYLDTSKYTSGTLYKYFLKDTDLNKDIKVHNSNFDTYSIYITLEYLLNSK